MKATDTSFTEPVVRRGNRSCVDRTATTAKQQKVNRDWVKQRVGATGPADSIGSAVLLAWQWDGEKNRGETTVVCKTQIEDERRVQHKKSP